MSNNQQEGQTNPSNRLRAGYSRLRESMNSTNNLATPMLDFGNFNSNFVRSRQDVPLPTGISQQQTHNNIGQQQSNIQNNSLHSLGTSNTHGTADFLSDIRITVNPDMGQLDEDDILKIELFQKTLQEKVESFLAVIDGKRRRILTEIEQDNLRLRSLSVTNSVQASNYLNRLQRIRLRAIETETIELQRLKFKIVSIVEEYKTAMSDYSTAKQHNLPAENPSDRFYQWITSLNLADHSKLTDGLQELSTYSKQIVSILETESFLNAQRADNQADQALLKSLNSAQHAQQQNIFPLHKLPPEILHLVLDRLSPKSNIVNLLTVCKLWALIIVKFLYYRPHVNKKTQLELFLRTMSNSSSDTVFDYRLMIKRLNFSFVGDYIHDKDLYFFVGCSNLERLTLVFCKHITSESVSAVLNNCKFLQSVDITGIKDVQDRIFDTLAASCPRVQGFYVPMARSVTLKALDNFIIHAPILKRVKITMNNNMNDDLVNLMASTCPLLVEVDITGSPNVHDESLINLFMKLPQLREFRITNNVEITDRIFLELAKSLDQLPALRLVDLSSCENITDKTIEKLVSLAPKLRNIFLGKCSRITDASLFSLAKLGKNLQTVHFGHCFNITDQGVRILVQSCPRIQYVDFACCTNLTNRTLYELSDLSKLKRIGLVKCSQMTDEGLLNMLSLRGRNDCLERVHLSYCANLSIYPIYELLMACPRLSHLSLTAVPSFLRPDITAFCRPAPSDFSENQRQIFCVFSGKGVHKLRQYLMSLTTPTNSPQTDINEMLGKYIVGNNLIQNGEQLDDAIERIGLELNQDSAAIIAATGMTQIPGLNNDFNFQNIVFDRINGIFTWARNILNGYTISDVEMLDLMHRTNRKFLDDPFNVMFEDTDPVACVDVSPSLNSELCQIVRKFHEIDERVDDFEVNVASLARIQYQYTGFLLNEMVHLYMLMVDLNHDILEIEQGVLSSGIDAHLKGYFVWATFMKKSFLNLEHKYMISTIVLRLYLKDSVTLITRQREAALNSERNAIRNGSVNNDRSATTTTVENSNAPGITNNTVAPEDVDDPMGEPTEANSVVSGETASGENLWRSENASGQIARVDSDIANERSARTSLRPVDVDDNNIQTDDYSDTPENSNAPPEIS
ncbi:SCF ubiquitin ligase complex subunit [Maudiozyma humilis]|uniref:SCF ubiquitin ligase complex subunit n=1 Tax=Maudiozyma humilis TaxID=51915 RepID=A0AAV5RZF8_MAUHU|nr:SCF ubiquitin ligase complex subunit [Kazachstania humilis]